MNPEQSHLSPTWDLIVVGGGPAGLAVARHVLLRQPTARILLLEKTKDVGGRTRTLTFAGKTELPCGAGVGRTHKDHRLSAWLTEMGFQKETWVSTPFYGFLEKSMQPFSLPTLVRRLERAVRPSDARRTFRAFAKEHLTTAEWQWFQSAMGYTDYLDADAWETVKYYGFDDNHRPLHGFTVPWTALAETTRDTLIAKGVVIRYGVEVVSIKENVVRWKSATGTAKAVVVAVPVQGLRALFPNHRAYRRNALNGQPFVRLYATLNAKGRAFMKERAHSLWHSGMAMVKGAFQKISVIDETVGVYRLAYADNARATALRKLLHNGSAGTQALSQELYKTICGVQGESISPQENYVRSWKACEWFPTGTHYYPPLPSWAPTRTAYLHEAQRPAPNVWVVGEAVSRDQGWTEGALASVEAILPELLHTL